MLKKVFGLTSRSFIYCSMDCSMGYHGDWLEGGRRPPDSQEPIHVAPRRGEVDGGRRPPSSELHKNGILSAWDMKANA